MRTDWTDIPSITKIIKQSFTKTEVIISAGYSPRSGKNYSILNQIIQDNNINTSHFRSNPFDYEKNLPTIVPDCLCMSDVIRAVGLQPRGQNEKTIKRWIKKLNIDTSHFDISAAKARGSIKNNIFVENSSAANSVVKRKVLRGNLIPYECSKCGLKDGWQGMPLNLQLDHKNGINNDHRLENLRFLCPNCHSQTPTWGHTVPT